MTVLGIVVYIVGFSHPNNGVSLAPNSLVIYKDNLLGILGQFKEETEF